MPFQVDFTSPDSEPVQKVRITFECTPQFADWILALATPLALSGQFTQSSLALPEALIMLGKFLDLTDLPSEHWSQSSRDLVDHFIADMSSYDQRLHFNYHSWLEDFYTELDSLEGEGRSEEDQYLFAVVRSVAAQIADRQATREQIALYCNVNGSPIEFRDWVERILIDRQARWVVERAHLGAFNPDRLKEILKNWRENRLEPSEGNEIPF